MSYFDKIKEKIVFVHLPKIKGDVKYDVDNIVELPIDDSYFYKGWFSNEHHYITTYHREILLPKLNEIFNFGLNIERDFHVVDKKVRDYDISMLYPNEEIKYEVFGFTANEHLEDCRYEDLVGVNGKDTPTEFHRLYKYAHCCSRIINKTIKSDRKLLISCDSQMIPSVMPLSVYFKEVWCFDNRTSTYFEKELESCEFTDVLFLLNNDNLQKYINNLK